MRVWEAVKFTIFNTWKASRKLFLVYTLTQIIIAFSFIINTLTFKEIIDSANHTKTLLGLSVFGVIVLRLIYEIIRKIIEGFSNYSWALLDSKQVVHMNQAFVEKVASLDLATFENPKNVTLIQRAFNRFQFQFKYYLKSFIDLVSSIVELSVSIGIFFIASPLMAIAIVTANLIPIIIRAKQANSIFLIYRADNETKMKFEYTSWNIMTRDVLPEVKINQAFDFFKKRLIEIYKKFTGNQLKIEKKYQVFNTLAEFFPIIVLFFFSIFITRQLADKQITTGTFVFLFTNIFIFAGALGRVGQNVGHLYADSNFIQEAVEFFALKPNITFPKLSNNQKQELTKKLEKPNIKVENVSFKYPNGENLVLKNVNLEIPYGQNIALIGENGAGKTTLVKILLRIYDPLGGRILINDVDIKEIPEDILYGVYSTLFQAFGKFYLTFKENLEMASGRKLTDDEITNYLKFSNAWEFVKDTKYKLDQQLGPEYKDGLDLSGGQWQRLAIARAYAKKAPILILDEPTSAVDARSEMEIFDRLIKEMEKNTLLFISHRFSTIKDAQRIVVLDKGKIIEDGTHESLIKQNGKYAHLYTIQAERYRREKIKN